MLAVCSSQSSSLGTLDMPVSDESIDSAAFSARDDASTWIEQYGDKVELHKGRHSTVWSAKDQCGAIVVIKAYFKQKMKPRHARHVVRETRLLQVFRDSRCNGVVNLQHAFEDDSCVYLIFDPCMKGDLYQLMTKHSGTLQEHFVACQVISPLLATLSLLHALDIVHRDVKTENIFITSSGEVQLGDFGLVAHKLHDQLVDRVGTLDYMAPEVLSMPIVDEAGADARQGSRQAYDEKVDIWAVGVLLYELLVGRPPFEVEDPRETARLILGAHLDSFPSHLPADCVDFIKAALQKQPELRPSATQLQHHLWLRRHLGSTRQAQMEQPALQPAEIEALRSRIYEAWSTDKLERDMGKMSLSDSEDRPGRAGPGDSAGPSIGVGCTSSKDGKLPVGAVIAASLPSSSARDTSDPGRLGGVPLQLRASMPSTSSSTAASDQLQGFRNASQAGTYKVLGKDLVMSVGNRRPSIGPGSSLDGKASKIFGMSSSGSITVTDPSARSVSGDHIVTASDEWSNVTESVKASSQSFTSGMFPRPSELVAAPKVWERSTPPAKAAGRSRFAS